MAQDRACTIEPAGYIAAMAKDAELSFTQVQALMHYAGVVIKYELTQDRWYPPVQTQEALLNRGLIRPVATRARYELTEEGRVRVDALCANCGLPHRLHVNGCCLPVPSVKEVSS
jgi:hypothetical protein